MSHARKRLLAVLRHVRQKLGPMRGYANQHLDALHARVSDESVPLDDEIARHLSDVLIGVEYKLEDLRQEAQANLRVTSRTITHAIRTGGRG